MTANEPATEQLLQRARQGSGSAINQLLALHRLRLGRMIAARLDLRLAPRIDPSDLVQDTLAVASERLPEYLNQPALPFYAWLHGLAEDRLADAHRRHVRAAKRSVKREEPPGPAPSSVMLADHLLASVTGASEVLRRQEQFEHLRETVDQLAPEHRAVLLLLYVEDCTAVEAAGILGVHERTVRRRHKEALRLLTQLFHQDSEGTSHD